MLSFSKIITFAAVAFGTLSQAIPLSPREVNTETCGLVPGQLKNYLTDVAEQLENKLGSFPSLINSGAPVSDVTPVLNDVVAYINVQLVCVKHLTGIPVEEVLKNGDGVLTVDDVKDLVCKILAVLFGALAPVIGLVQDTGLLKTLVVIVNLACAFVQVIIEVTGGFDDLLAYYLRAYVAIGVAPWVLSILRIPSPF